MVYHFENAQNSSKTQSVVILKLPRSGSSWLVQLMNRLPDVYISKEIIQYNDLQSYSPSQRGRHLANALKGPTDKLSYKARWLPSGRFWEDYLLHSTWKWAHALSVVGLSVNVEYLKDMDWDILRREHVKNPKFVVYLRSNLVKQSISGITGRYIKQNCGSSNFRENPSSSEIICEDILKSRFHLSVSVFAEELVRWTQRYRVYLHFVQIQVQQAHNWPVHVLYYEDLQSNLANSMTSLMSFLSSTSFLSYEDETHIHKLFESYLLSHHGGWKKRTKDDLSEVIRNYEEIHNVVLPNIPQHTPQNQSNVEVPLILEETYRRNHHCRLVQEMLIEKYYRRFTMDAGSLTSIYNCAKFLLDKHSQPMTVQEFMDQDDDATNVLST
jgi:hypothetical protein